MEKRPAVLEAMLLGGSDIGLARGGLVASGVGTEEELTAYLDQIERLHRAIGPAAGPGDEVSRARGIFQWLWRTKPHRYQYHGSFALTQAIDAQSGDGEPVGNCLGLTVLYNVLAQRAGLEVGAVHLEEAFGLGPHVFTVLFAGGRSIDVENILHHGFDYDGHLGAARREQWGGRELIADIYHSTANTLSEAGRWEQALECYDKAILLNPGYGTVRLNKGIALDELGRVDEAQRWLEEGAG